MKTLEKVYESLGECPDMGSEYLCELDELPIVSQQKPAAWNRPQPSCHVSLSEKELAFLESEIMSTFTNEAFTHPISTEERHDLILMSLLDHEKEEEEKQAIFAEAFPEKQLNELDMMDIPKDLKHYSTKTVQKTKHLQLPKKVKQMMELLVLNAVAALSSASDINQDYLQLLVNQVKHSLFNKEKRESELIQSVYSKITASGAVEYQEIMDLLLEEAKKIRQRQTLLGKTKQLKKTQRAVRILDRLKPSLKISQEMSNAEQEIASMTNNHDTNEISDYIAKEAKILKKQWKAKL